MSGPTVWRVVWDRSGITMRSDWSVHYDIVSEFYDEKCLQMPGTDPRIESATVNAVSDVQALDFAEGDDD